MPAIAAAWKMPDRGSRDQAPMAVLGELLAGGDASLFYQGLVKGREIALNVDALYGLTSPWEYDGPTLFTVFALYKPNSSADAMLAAMDEEIAKVVKDGVDDATLKRVKTRMLADWYNDLESFINRADTLAKLQTLWGDANVVNQIPGWIDAVTSADVQRAARDLPDHGQPHRHRPQARRRRAAPLPAAPPPPERRNEERIDETTDADAGVSLAVRAGAFAAERRRQSRPARPCRRTARTSRSRCRRSPRRRWPTA